ncbi:MAG: hypothetical protein ABDH28_04335 [Brevinematia bacterium]
MGDKSKGNGWKEYIKEVSYNLQVVKETMLNIDKKVAELLIKHETLKERVDKIEEEGKKRIFQNFYVIVGAITSFLTGLVLFIISFMVRWGGK